MTTTRADGNVIHADFRPTINTLTLEIESEILYADDQVILCRVTGKMLGKSAISHNFLLASVDDD